jgi:hypothetical protein
VRRDHELYVLFRTLPLVEYITGVRKQSYKEVWLVRDSMTVYLRTPDDLHRLRPYKLINITKAPTGSYPTVDVIDLCSKQVHKLVKRIRKYPPDHTSRVEIVLGRETGMFCFVRMDGYSERVSPWTH